MKRFLTMTFVITLLSSTTALGATKTCINKVNTCKLIKLVNCVKLICNINNNCNNPCIKPQEPVIDDIVPEVPTIEEEPQEVIETPTIEEGTQQEITETPVQEVVTPEAPSEDSFILDIEKEVVELVNKERAKYGLSPLEIDTEVSKVARLKSQDMADLNYFSHTSPTYGSPFDMLAKFNIKYKSAGENIAMGQKTAEAVVNAWMNSEGHRANILNSSYTHIGVGYVLDGNTPYWTQMFISK